MSGKFFLGSLFVALLVTASASAATTTWNGGTSSNWDTTANWTSTQPTTGDTVNINAVTSPAVYPVLSTPVASLGYITNVNVGSGAQWTLNSGANIYMTNFTLNATGTVGPTVTINAGANLYAANSGSHYWNAGTVNDKGTMYVNRTIYVGSGGTASVPRVTTINVTEGGVFNVGNQNGLILGNNTTGSRGILNVWGANLSGTTSLVSFGNNNFTIGRSPGTGLIDLRNGGRLEYSATQRTTITNGITAGTVVAGDPRELLTEGFVPGSTTRYRLTTYVNNQAFNPTYLLLGVTTPLSTTNDTDLVSAVAMGTQTLGWKAPLERGTSNYAVEQRVYSNFATGIVPVDVNGISTDPNGDALTLLTTIPRTAATAPTTNTITMNSAAGGIYQFRVDCYDNTKTHAEDPNYPIITKGQSWYFRTANSAPIITMATDTAISQASPTGSTWTSAAVISDDSLPLGAAVTGTWTQLNGPVNAIPVAIPVTKASPNISLNLTTPGRYYFQLQATDTALTTTAKINVSVYADSCAAAKAVGGYTALAGDFNADCKVTFIDFATLASNWGGCFSTIGGCN